MIPADTRGPGRPSSARLSNLWLGGSWHTPADEALAAEIEQACPAVREMARASRLFTARVTAWAASDGLVSQFIDLGAGMAPGESVHQVARAVRRSARVGYVDSDPEVVDWLSDVMPDGRDKGIAVVRADLSDPADVLSDPSLLKVINPAEPVCVIAALVLHFWTAEQAKAIIAGYAERLAAGSLIAVSTPRIDDQKAWERLEAVYPLPVSNFTAEQLSGLLDGLELVPPGIGAAFALRPGSFAVPCKRRAPGYALAGIGRKR